MALWLKDFLKKEEKSSIYIFKSVNQTNHKQKCKSNSGANIETCQTPKMELFAKIVKRLLVVNYFCKTLHLR